MPLSILTGDDEYSIEAAIGGLVQTGGFDGFDVERVDARSSPPGAVLMTVGTPGLFASKRLVVVKGLGQEKRERKAAGSKSTSEEPALCLDDLLRVTPESTSVVVVMVGLRSDARLMKEAVAMARAKKAELRAFPAPKAKDMPHWLQQRAREAGITLEPVAARQMALRIGDRVSVAGRELEKLSTAAGPNETVSASLVEDLVPKTAEESIFPLIDAISEGKTDRAFQLLGAQLLQIHGNEAELILPLIRLMARQLRILLNIKLFSAEGKKRAEIIAALKLSDFFADRYFSQAARLSQPRLSASIERLAAADQAVKNGEAGEAILQLLVADLTTPQPT